MVRIIISPTIEQLQEFLNRIKWDVKHIGFGCFRIYNYKNNPTSFMIRSNIICEISESGCVFGDHYCGSLNINLRSIRLKFYKEDNFVSISLKDVDANSFFISFYGENQTSQKDI